MFNIRVSTTWRTWRTVGSLPPFISGNHPNVMPCEVAMAARAARLRAGRSAPGMPPPAATCHERSPSQLAQLLLILSSLIGENSTVQSHDSQADCNEAAEELPAAAVDGGAVAVDVLADNCGADGAAAQCRKNCG
jgi:hypothetical protein